MMLRSWIRSCAFAGYLCTAPAAFAQNMGDVEIKATQVRGNIYMLEGRGGNIGVSVGPDGILIIDDQFAPLADKIRAALGKLGEGKLKFILNTHFHGDHTGGNVEFGPEAPIIAHTNVRKRLSTSQEMFGRTVEPLPKEGLPVITFDDALSIHFNDEEIKAVHFPGGHTDGDIVVFFTKSNVVHMGDDLFSGMFPFVDFDHGGNVLGLTRNIEKIMKDLPADVKIIPGHGPLSTLDDLKKFHHMLVETTKIVDAGMRGGKSLEDIQKQGLGEEWKPWASSFIPETRWIELIHRSLTENR
jgi:glyoxylase-like metal-dependent hydrolase (beta-lactamase superfamily II)